MKTLSVKSPWAEMIISGEKRIENRSWGTAHRGPIAIHRCGPGGAIIGVVDLVDIMPWQDALRTYPDQDRHISGPACWVLARPRACAPVPCRGRLKLWEGPDIH